MLYEQARRITGRAIAETRQAHGALTLRRIYRNRDSWSRDPELNGPGQPCDSI